MTYGLLVCCFILYTCTKNGINPYGQELVRIISPTYMLLLIGGIFMYLSFILKDVSAIIWWFAHISLVLYGVFIYIISNRKYKKWIAEEINPIIADIDKVLDGE